MWLNRKFVALLAIAGGLMVSFLPKPSSASASDGWQVPVEQPVLVRQFRQPSADWSAGHRGVDYLVSPDQLVFAPHGGTVRFAGWVVNRYLISISHEDGLVSTIEPVCSKKLVGDFVQTDELVGVVCAGEIYPSHCLPELCIHFALKTQSGYLSPLYKLGQLSPSRLKPWDGLNCIPASNGRC